MKKLALGALLAGLMVACGGDGGGVKLIDASIDAKVACDPIAQTGCESGERCTWIIDLDGTETTDEIGHVGCVAQGATAAGAACENARASVNGGADTCVGGNLCVSGLCKPICDPDLVPGAGTGACAAQFECVSYSGVFEVSDVVSAGICEPGCDPLTQRLNVTDAEACGSADPTVPEKTCVPVRGFKSFACAPSGDVVYENTDRKPPLGNSRGFFANGCAPGFIPYYFADVSGSMMVLCSGMCSPIDMDATIAAANMDTNPDLNAGNPETPGKLTADPMPVAGHATCVINVKGSVAQADGTQDCRYLWYSLSDGILEDAPGASPYNDTLGVCYNYKAFKIIDTDNDEVADAFDKSCKELLEAAPDTDPYGSAWEHGCYTLEKTMTKAGPTTTRKKNPHRLGGFRLANGTGVAARHIFE